MTGRVVVVGLGPGDPGMLSVAVRDAIDAIPYRYLRTRHHPSASAVDDAVDFDDVYDRAASFDEVYATITARLVEAAGHHGRVLYAVPGSPLVAERTVELLRAETGVELELLPALSFVDLAWDRLGVDPFAASVRLVDGHRFALEAAGQTGPLLVAQCDRPHVLSAIKLAVDVDPGPVTVLQRLGTAGEVVRQVPWADLDRDIEPDLLTCIWIPRLAEPVAGELVRLVELMETLRDRCPWDRVQTHRSLARHLLEETYEVLDAIEELPAAVPAGEVVTGGDEAWEHLEEELGDLLFQVVFHSRLGTEAGRFGLVDVARGLHDKLVARHPHIFPPVVPADPEIPGDAAGLVAGWEQRKKQEKGRASVMDGMPVALPALLSAAKAQGKATTVGLDWPDVAGVWDKVAEELAELRTAAQASDAAAVAGELGDVLFSVVNLARKLDVDPEMALRASVGRFAQRVRLVEHQAEAAGIEPGRASAGTIDSWWEQAKRHLSADP